MRATSGRNETKRNTAIAPLFLSHSTTVATHITSDSAARRLKSRRFAAAGIVTRPCARGGLLKIQQRVGFAAGVIFARVERSCCNPWSYLATRSETFGVLSCAPV